MLGGEEILSRPRPRLVWRTAFVLKEAGVATLTSFRAAAPVRYWEFAEAADVCSLSERLKGRKNGSELFSLKVQ